jgi:hypothetical protein
VPVSPRFFAALGDYLDHERPTTAATEKVFVVLKGPRRGRPLSAAGLDEILATSARPLHTPRGCTTPQRDGAVP